jgi:hypothetical protein
MVSLKVGMCQCSLDGDALLGVEGLEDILNPKIVRDLLCTHQGLGQEVNSKRVRIREELREWLAFAEWKGSDVVSRSAGGDGVELIKRGCAENVEDKGELVVVIPAREQWLAREHFCETLRESIYSRGGNELILTCSQPTRYRLLWYIA